MSPKVKVTLFLILTFSFSILSIVPVILTGNGTILNTITLMWSPGLAAILTQLIATSSLRGLGWRLGSARWLVIAYILPIIYGLPVYTFTWLTGLGGFLNPYLFHASTRQYASPDLPTALAVFLLINLTKGMAMQFALALGEEIGWRGLLVPELAKTSSFTKTALVSGIVWASWHMPLVFLAGYNGGTPLAYSAACFAVMIIAISFPLAWLRLKSGSLWTAALLHASHNLFIQGIFDRLTDPTGISPYVIGEFGIGLVLTSLVLAYIFWRMQQDGSLRAQSVHVQPVVRAEQSGAH